MSFGIDSVPRRDGFEAHISRELYRRLDKLVHHLGSHDLVVVVVVVVVIMVVVVVVGLVVVVAVNIVVVVFVVDIVVVAFFPR